MGQVLYILFSIPLTEKEEAARAVCLGSHAARGDYGDCDSAFCGPARYGEVFVAPLARRGGGCGSTRMQRDREVQLTPRNNCFIRAAPK